MNEGMSRNITTWERDRLQQKFRMGAEADLGNRLADANSNKQMELGQAPF